ncbi:MAG: AI-2E family transporter [Clostridia bacterium]|nr:AI-2E family transporter [Clostridia bacterium]
MKKKSFKSYLKIAAFIFAIYLGIHYWPGISTVIKTVFSSATPIIIGVILAYMINILMSFYERHYFPKSTKKAVIKSRRPVCLAGSIITLLGIIAVVFWLVATQLVDCIQLLIAKIPGAVEFLVAKLNEFDFVPEDIIDSLMSIDWKSRIGSIIETVTSGLGSVMNIAVTAVASTVSVISSVVIGIIFAIYVLFDKNNLANRFKRLIKAYIPSKIYEKATHITRVTDDCFHRFIVGQCTEAVILGVLCLIGMLILRIPYAAMISVLIAFTALIPIVGAFIGAGVGAFLILTESPAKALVFLIFIVVLQQIEGNLIYPKVVGSSMGLPGIWVLAAVTIGGGVLGIGGMLIGVPLTAVIYKLIKENLAEKEKVMSAPPTQKTNS